MNNSEIPCGWEPCKKSDIIELKDVLIDIAEHDYEYATPVFDSHNTFYMDEPILKFKKLAVKGNSRIEFELNNENDYYALVIDELEVQNGTDEKKTILFQWYDGNFDKLYEKLKGKNGPNANPPSGTGAHGLPGQKGGKGGTRHSPAIFIFINSLKLTSSNLEDISFEFSLKGIPGGWGGQGGLGSNGNTGYEGKDGRQGGIFRACKPGKDGGRGGNPGKGGQGGNGGCGGDGPELLILVGEKNLYDILEKSKYDVSGADPITSPECGDQPGLSGCPGKAGLPGRGGEGGRRAGNCDGGNRGPSGEPLVTDPEHSYWNLGTGLPGAAGFDGNYDFDEFQEVYRIVFNDPATQSFQN